MNYTVLITGANRGIGKALLQLYLGLPNTTVIVGIRDPGHPSADDIRHLPVAANSHLIIVKIDSASSTDAQAAIDILESQHGIKKIDTLIANAGIANWAAAAQTTVSELEDHLKINAVGPFALYSAARRLLSNSKTPKFIVISTELGSFGLMKERPLPAIAYGASKAAVNYLVVKLHHEEPDLIALPIHPGWVNTDSGNRLAKIVGMNDAPVTPSQAAEGVFEQIEKATKEKTSGQFIDFKGNAVSW